MPPDAEPVADRSRSAPPAPEHAARDELGGDRAARQNGERPGMQVLLRPAEPADASTMAQVWLRSFAAALPMVRRAHDDADVHAWFAGHVVPSLESWVAVAEPDGVVGLLVLDGSELAQLYLEPAWRGRGLGDRLVDLAQRRRPDGLWLHTFQVNAPAQRFYRRHGFVAGERTDGRGNEEREPDVRYTWTPPR